MHGPYRKLMLYFPGKTDPYVILSLGDQVIRSKKNSQTTVIGPPGEPIWNQVKFLIVYSSPVVFPSIEAKSNNSIYYLLVSGCHLNSNMIKLRSMLLYFAI